MDRPRTKGHVSRLAGGDGRPEKMVAAYMDAVADGPGKQEQAAARLCQRAGIESRRGKLAISNALLKRAAEAKDDTTLAGVVRALGWSGYPPFWVRRYLRRIIKATSDDPRRVQLHRVAEEALTSLAR